jgi:hypothetical protein
MTLYILWKCVFLSLEMRMLSVSDVVKLPELVCGVSVLDVAACTPLYIQQLWAGIGK